MTLDEARVILGPWVRDNNCLSSVRGWDSDEHPNERDYGRFIGWTISEKTITLDEDFTADELEAMAIWMRAHGIQS